MQTQSVVPAALLLRSLLLGITVEIRYSKLLSGHKQKPVQEYCGIFSESSLFLGSF